MKQRHFDTNSPEHVAWCNMRRRCKSKPLQKWYGHITICQLWLNSYTAFLNDVGRRPSDKHTLDRIKSHKGYYPGNVRWATRNTQSRNTKNHSTNTSGIRGVSWSKSKKKWRTSIYVNNVQKFLGYFDDIKDAAKARKQGEDKYWGNER